MATKANDIDFKAAIIFLKQYSGHEYRKDGTSGYSDEQLAEFKTISNKGRSVVDQFKKMADFCKEKFGLILKGAVHWLDGSSVKVRPYIWAELALPAFKRRPESISIFANSSGNNARYRFSLEFRNDKRKGFPGAKENFHTFLDSDLPKESKLVYVAGSDENGAPKIIGEPRDVIKTKVQKREYDKVQLCRIVEDGDSVTNEDFFNEMVASIAELLPFYKEIVERAEGQSPTDDSEGSQSGNDAPISQADVVFPKNIIFYGAPGTGKTYKTVNQAVAICLKKPLSEVNAMPRKVLTAKYRDLIASGDISFVTFHQSYSYEDFVIGIFPELSNGQKDSDGGIRYFIKDGVFKYLCDTARNHKDTNFVLIIDEINRGNISKIFGELITLIEESKREGQPEMTTVLLPYMDRTNIIRFSVPNNVYIIGTMNTADRSIQHIDTALRRRFVFEEVLPNTSLFKDVDITSNGKTVNVGMLLEAINRRIKRYFDREHVIGHAYFMDLKKPGLDDDQKLLTLGNIFNDKIIPLLQDYFFEDYSKIQQVLGETPETDDSISLIRRVKGDVYEDDDGGRDVYEVAPKADSAYNNIETYILMAK